MPREPFRTKGVGQPNNWTDQALGIVVRSAVGPTIFVLTWSGCTCTGAVTGTWMGLAVALTVWCSLSARLGPITVETLGDEAAMLAGNLTGLLLSPIIAVTVSLAAPRPCDWGAMRSATEGYVIVDDAAAEDRVMLEQQVRTDQCLDCMASSPLSALCRLLEYGEDIRYEEETNEKFENFE